jgi:hypothetical protein
LFADDFNLITQLNSACFAIRTLKLFVTIEDLRMVYSAYVHSVIMNGLPFRRKIMTLWHKREL